MNRPATLNPDQEALADTVRAYCRAKCTPDVQRAPADRFPVAFWAGLAELGIFAVARPDEDGGAGEIVSASIELGRSVAPGPIAATYFAAHALPADVVERVLTGAELVSFGVPPLLPWSALAGIWIEWSAGRAWLARRVGDVEPVDTLGNEPWGRVWLEPGAPLDRVAAAADLYHLAAAAYAVGAGSRVMATAVEHARTREQFGRRIGDFQAVAHPLANASVELEAAKRLSILAAHAVDARHDHASSIVAAARLSAGRAAMNAAFAAHQTLGAIGYSIEGPIAHATQRIRQVTLLADIEAGLEEQVLSAFSTERQCQL